MPADIELVHIMAAGVLAYALYAAVVATATRVKMRRITGDSSPDPAYVALCASHGWTYAPEDDVLPTRFQLMPTDVDSALTPGPESVNVVTGTHTGLPFVSYEHRSWSRERLVQGLYRYRMERLHVVGFDLGHLHPWLHLERRPTGLLPWLVFRNKDAFDRAYRMETTRRSFATAVLHDEMRAHLLKSPARYQFDGTWLVMVVDGPARAEDLEPRLADLTTFLDLVPDHLLNRY